MQYQHSFPYLHVFNIYFFSLKNDSFKEEAKFKWGDVSVEKNLSEIKNT